MFNYNGIFKIGQVFNRFIPRTELKQQGRYSYGLNDKLPQEIIEMLSSNPTALRAIMKRAEYISANGFVDETLNDKMVTAGKTARKLLFETAIQYSIFECVSWHVARKASGEVGSVDLHPFELLRRRIDGNFDYNKTLGTNQYKNEFTLYPCFNKNFTPSDFNKNYKGEILYEWNKTPIAFNFPIPTWFAGEFTIKTGSELSLMDLELVENGFMPSAILTLIGQIDNVTEDKDGYTQKDRLDQTLKKWTSKSKDSTTGKSQRHSLMVLNANSKEEVADLKEFSIAEIISGSIEKKAAVDKDTSMLFDVNPVLLGWEVSTILGNDGAMKNAQKIMADSVIGAQNLIKECFEKVYPGLKWDITTLNPFKSVVERSEDQKVLDTINSLSPLLGAEVVRNMPKEILLRLVGIKDVIKEDGTNN